MPWLQFHLIIDKQRAPLIELLFEELGALSVTLSDAADEALLEPPPGTSPLWQQTCVTALFEGDSDSDRLRGALNQALSADVTRSLRLERLEDQAWERSWLQDFHPMRFGERLWICPDGQRPAGQQGIFIDLDPGLAFGTGTHPTTALCLQWLDRHPPRGQQVLDFGCGSGILAVAALKLGARQVSAVDHDPQALQASRANAAKNGVLQQLTLLGSDQPLALQVDLVMANILAGTLIELQPLLAQQLRPGGWVILSGILVEQATAVGEAYHDTFEMQPPATQDDWVLLAGQRR